MTAIWTSCRTWTTGELVSAALMNTHVRDNLEYLYARSADLITMRGAIRMHVADSLGGVDSHRLVFGGVTYPSWHLCNGDADIDGSGVTAPDMRDRFVVGAGSTYAQGATGGAATEDVSHTHASDTLAAAATAMANHVHPFGTTATRNTTSGLGYGEAGATTVSAGVHYHNIAGNTGNPGSNPTHVHSALSTGVTASGGSAALATLPPYKGTYWFICVTDVPAVIPTPTALIFSTAVNSQYIMLVG